jgi:hypothetical protein
LPWKYPEKPLLCRINQASSYGRILDTSNSASIDYLNASLGRIALNSSIYICPRASECGNSKPFSYKSNLQSHLEKFHGLSRDEAKVLIS